MRRRDLLKSTAALGLTLAASPRAGAASLAGGAAVKLEPPAKETIPVAIAISEGVEVIDFAGPWEVFQDVHVAERGSSMEAQMPFRLYTVAESQETIRGSGGLKLVPNHTFQSAPAPRVVVVPAQRGNPALHEWLRKQVRTADVVMSVCTGAFQLAKAGLLSGLEATTHHDSLDYLAKEYPDVRVRRGVRFVENARISTAGGLSAGIDLALRVVERYYGRAVAERTAAYMEYQGRGWIA